MTHKLAAAATACALAWGAGAAAAAQAADPVCKDLTARLAAQDFPTVSTFTRISLAMNVIADRSPRARPIVGREGLRLVVLERLEVTCAASPSASVGFLGQVLAMLGDFDGALTAAKRQVEIAQSPDELRGARSRLALAQVLVGDEAAAVAALRANQAVGSDAALLADLYGAAAAGGMLLGPDTPAQIAALEGAVRHGRVRASEGRLGPNDRSAEDFAVSLMHLGELRHQRREHPASLAAYAEAAAVSSARAEQLRGAADEARRLADVENLMSEAYAGMAEAAAATNDRAGALAAARSSVAALRGGAEGPIPIERLFHPGANPPALRLARVAEALMRVGEVEAALPLYETAIHGFGLQEGMDGILAPAPLRREDAGRALTGLARAYRMGGELQKARRAVDEALKQLDGGTPPWRPDLAGALAERAEILSATGDRKEACATLRKVADHLREYPYLVASEEGRAVQRAADAARPAACGQEVRRSSSPQAAAAVSGR